MPILFEFVIPFIEKYWGYILAFLIVICLSFSIAWELWNPKPKVPETAKPAVVQADGSIILQKTPDANAKPPMAIPKGSVVERVVKITVQAKTPIQTIAGTVEVKETVTQMVKSLPTMLTAKEDHIADAGKMIECPPVTLEMALVRLPDDTRRVIAKSEDGIILSAIDIPVADALPPVMPKVWSAGAVANPFKQAIGAYVDRDYGWLRTGATLMQSEKGRFPDEFIVKAGIVF